MLTKRALISAWTYTGLFSAGFPEGNPHSFTQSLAGTPPTLSHAWSASRWIALVAGHETSQCHQCGFAGLMKISAKLEIPLPHQITDCRTQHPFTKRAAELTMKWYPAQRHQYVLIPLEKVYHGEISLDRDALKKNTTKHDINLKYYPFS